MAKVFIQESTLTAIGDAIRTQTGTTAKIAPGDMPTKILGIETGGGGYEPTDTELKLDGDMTMAFASNKFNWVIENYGDRIYMSNCYPLTKMFYKSSYLQAIPFTLTYSNVQNTSDVSEIFSGCNYLSELPAIANWKPVSIQSIFKDCWFLREVPDSFVNSINWTSFEAITSKYGAKAQGMFEGCKSLRKFPVGMIHFANCEISYTYHPYNMMAYSCSSVDEITNIPVDTNALTTSYLFSSTFYGCNRVKSITFAPIDGTVNWTNQTITLTGGVGYCNGNISDRITGYNSGITRAKEVTDDETYAALKDDPDWFTANSYYSRYDHDSAVETINSLPTTTGTGCAIAFEGYCGGGNRGYINTLTEAEIAVATAKGWTVSF